MIDTTGLSLGYFNRPDYDLEEFALFSIMVAGKTAKSVAKQLDAFLKKHPGNTPFVKVNRLIKAGKLGRAMRSSRLGMYGKLSKAFREIIKLDLRTCSLHDLEAIHGVGPKTARFFLIYTRQNQHYAVIDTHILKFLKEKGHAVPKSTPPAGKRYNELEAIFLKYCRESGEPVSDFDFRIWSSYRDKRSRAFT